MTIWQKIGMVFKSSVNKYFTKVLDEVKDDEKYLHDAATITYNIYNYVENPNATLSVIEEVVNVVDPALLPTIEAALPKIAANFTAFADDVRDATDVNDLIKRIGVTMRAQELKEFTFLTHNLTAFFSTAIRPGTLIGKIFTVIESVWKGFTQPEIQKP